MPGVEDNQQTITIAILPFLAVTETLEFFEQIADYYRKYEEILKNYIYRQHTVTKWFQTFSDDIPNTYACYV